MTAKNELQFIPGDTFRKQFTWIVGGTPADLTGADASFVVKDQYGTVLITPIVGGGITLGGGAGTIDILISATDTADFPVNTKGTYHLHIIESNGDERSLICGIADFSDCINS